MQLQVLAESAKSAESARDVARAELELQRRHQEEATARAEEDMARLAGHVRDLVPGGPGQEQRAVPRARRHAIRPGAPAAQGDLAQRQQAIEELLNPLSETLTRYERGIQQMEAERKGAYATLNERVAALHHGHEHLEKETRNLVTALRSPQRGAAGAR